MTAYHAHCLLFMLSLTVPPESRSAEPATAPLRLQLISLDRGNHASSFGSDPQKFATTAVYKAAQKSGIDLSQSEHPLVVFKYDAGRLFYLFYNDVVNVPDGRYLIQRAKRTTINLSSNGESTTQVAYLVEALKTIDGRSKKPDQHFGSFSLQGCERREIIKELEIGIGEIPDIAEGTDWPFDPGKLFHRVQPYGVDAETFERVMFQDSVRWTIRMSFDRHGNYELRCPELGIELVRRLPVSSSSEVNQGTLVPEVQPQSRPEIDPSTTDIVLREGEGVLGVVVGESRLTDATRQLGEPKTIERLKAAANYHFEQQITCNIPDDQPVNTIFTQPGFGGQTGKGIRHGDTRDRVLEAYGMPRRNTRGTATFDGVIFWFDDQRRVNKIVILRKPERMQ